MECLSHFSDKALRVCSHDRKLLAQLPIKKEDGDMIYLIIAALHVGLAIAYTALAFSH